MNALAGNRRQFLVASSALSVAPLCLHAQSESHSNVVIIGGGLGGVSAALASLQHGLSVILTESTDWVGGQLTSQGVPPDEHQWIESTGANQSYRELRSRIRSHYRRFGGLTPEAAKVELLNPGNGNVSRLCSEPRVSLAVLQRWLEPYVDSGQLTILYHHEPVAADVDGDEIRSVTVASTRSGDKRVLTGDFFVDATELGDLLPLAGAEYVVGSEAQTDTNELHADVKSRPDNQQAFTMCFAIDHVAGEDHTIDRPNDYAFWRDFVPTLSPPWPGKLLDFTYTHPRSGKPKRLGFDPQGGRSVDGTLNLWTYRRIIDRSLFLPDRYDGDVSLINWPQNDYLLGNLIDVDPAEKMKHISKAKELSLSLLYWLQTEAPRRDGGTGFPGLRLRGDLMGTEDGLAKSPYIRESRRIRAMFTVLEEHVGREQRASIASKDAALAAAPFQDSVGVGSYPIDLHPTTGGDNYIDFESLRFQIPLGALLPVRITNLLPACKNIGTTHVTSGCYRLHPVEWGIGEAVGHLVGYAIGQRVALKSIYEFEKATIDFQKMIRKHGVQTEW